MCVNSDVFGSTWILATTKKKKKNTHTESTQHTAEQKNEVKFKFSAPRLPAAGEQEKS